MIFLSLNLKAWGNEEDSQYLEKLKFGDTQQILRSPTLFNNSFAPSILYTTIFRQPPTLNLQDREQKIFSFNICDNDSCYNAFFFYIFSHGLYLLFCDIENNIYQSTFSFEVVICVSPCRLVRAGLYKAVCHLCPALSH